jgi:hypothetical protein
LGGLDAIKAATRDLHTTAERAGIIADILAGRASRGGVALQSDVRSMYAMPPAPPSRNELRQAELISSPARALLCLTRQD